MRRKINNLINSGAMKVGEFQRAINVTSNSYLRFMRQNGAYKGEGCDCFTAAAIFFKKRELEGVKEPRKKIKKAQEDKLNDVSGVHLEGEEKGEVPVYETCDEVRKKINAYLRKDGISKAGFLREAAKAAFPEGKSLSSTSLQNFVGKKGPSAGNTNGVFYAGYVFFEKLRIRDGKPKSDHRCQMERIWNGSQQKDDNKPGFDIKRANVGFWCGPNERPYEDQYGLTHIERMF